jgi:hypothetical protein
MFTRERLRNVLAVLGFITLFLALMPYFRIESGTTADAAMMEFLQQNPDAMPSTSEYRLGWAHSPLIHYRSERTLTIDGSGFSAMQKAKTTIGWLSWSSLTLVIALGLFWVAGKLRGRPPAPETSPIKG